MGQGEGPSQKPAARTQADGIATAVRHRSIRTKCKPTHATAQPGSPDKTAVIILIEEGEACQRRKVFTQAVRYAACRLPSAIAFGRTEIGAVHSGKFSPRWIAPKSYSSLPLERRPSPTLIRLTSSRRWPCGP